jgi:hypothetical protein
MEDVSKQANLERPDLIHSTRLRKYVATVSQVCPQCYRIYYRCYDFTTSDINRSSRMYVWLLSWSHRLIEEQLAVQTLSNDGS